MAALADFFPLLAVLALLAMFILSVRLDRRMSRSAYSAGAAEPQRPEPVGLSETPWELSIINAQLNRTRTVPRYELVATVNRLSAAAGLNSPTHRVPIDANAAAIEIAVSQIEQRLGLPPLTPTNDTSERT